LVLAQQVVLVLAQQVVLVPQGPWQVRPVALKCVWFAMAA